MKLKYLTTSIFTTALLIGCAQAENTAQNTVDSAKAATAQVAEKTMDKVDKMDDKMKSAGKGAKKMMRPGVDVSGAVPGVYKSESTHAYITFQYMHQGYARPTLRWNDFDATVNLDPSNPAASGLEVTIDAASIDSGVAKFDEHLVSADFFDVANHPKITFKSTGMKEFSTGTGKVTGDLTMKGVTKPVDLIVKLNKVGENFRSKKPMIGISGTARLKRSDWDLGKYTPLVGDDVDINIEVEFIKEE